MSGNGHFKTLEMRRFIPEIGVIYYFECRLNAEMVIFFCFRSRLKGKTENVRNFASVFCLFVVSSLPPGWGQFHQQFTCSFFVHTYVFCEALMCLQFGFVIYWRKEIGAKTA